MLRSHVSFHHALLAYDTDVGNAFDQLFQAFTQIQASNISQFWLSLAHQVPASPSLQQLLLDQSETINDSTYLVSQDLRAQVAQYTKAYTTGTDRIVVVAHSQGNLYANEVYLTLFPDGQPSDTFKIVAVATPASDVAGGGSYTTLFEDTIATVGFPVGDPLALKPNVTDIPPVTCVLPWDCHAFVTSYLLGAVPSQWSLSPSAKLILDDVAADIPSISPSPIASTFDKDLDGWFAFSAIGGPFSQWVSNSGNPGGAASLTTNIPFAARTSTRFAAPSKFLGDLSAFYGGSLSFDFQANLSGPAPDQALYVELAGPSFSFQLFATPEPGCDPFSRCPFGISGTWKTYTLGLTEADWVDGSGRSVSQKEFLSDLANVDNFLIIPEYTAGPAGLTVAASLDNVLLQK